MSIDRVRRIALLALFAFVTLPARAEPLLDTFAVAVENDRVDEVKRLLARGMDPDSVNAQGDTMLCLAARNGNVQTVQALLAAKARPELANRFGDTPLMLAALKGDLPTARALQAARAATQR